MQNRSSMGLVASSAPLLALVLAMGCPGNINVGLGNGGDGSSSTGDGTSPGAPVGSGGTPETGTTPTPAPTDPTDPGTGNPPTDPDPTAPPPSGGGGSAPDPVCNAMPSKSLPNLPGGVYYGTSQPSILPLNAAQMMAIGSWNTCSGLLITGDWVLTAHHCQLDTSAVFCLGQYANNPTVCLNAVEVVDQPQGGDMTLVRLEADARDYAAVEPIPVFTGTLGNSWIGVTAEASGYGQQEDGGYGEREFTAEPIYQIAGDIVSINGEGQHGVCFGDSGGPLMVIAQDGTARVAGALSNGAESCTGIDNYTRVDVYRDWIESVTGAAPAPGPQGCNGVTATGSCNASGTAATYCQNNQLVVDSCGAGESCSNVAEGNRCIPVAADPCLGITFEGQCGSGVLKWCDSGQILERDCGQCGEACVLDGQVGWTCEAAPPGPAACGDVDYLGHCIGDVSEWCNNSGQLETRDCAAQGQGCGFVDNNTGYFCSDNIPVAQTGGCGNLTYEGECAGDVARWCNTSDQISEEDCAAQGKTCGYVDASTGYYCQ